MQQQHVIDWWKYRGYRVVVLSDWRMCCVHETVFLQRGVNDDDVWRAIARNYR